MRIDHYSLELFISVAQTGSIARAASLNHIAASALSRRLTDLEAVIGLPLFIRSAAGVELTEAGRHALSCAKSVDGQLRQMAREIQSLGGQVAGTVRLFANASAIVGFLPELLKGFQAAYPLVEIALTEQISDEVIRACLDGRADVGISANREAPSQLQTWRFAHDPLMVVLPPGHELEQHDTLAFDDVIRYPVVALQAGGSLDQVLKERAEAARTPLHLVVTVNSFDAQCRMVEAGLGIGVVPTSAASAFAGSRNFVRKPLDEEWARNRSLQVHAYRKTPALRAVQALIDFLTQHKG
ncbi:MULTISPECIES: LysR substrate-binding domain-containing protein [unclassified Caballeronia]|uniref:LysR substrate-binding domain-containing protein n=1 Tax=unclassified Caballeronia TaxID=2646786 RepID=UPI0028607A5D|nr:MULTISPECIES: LysR substrate-binding domain-containing protein [unclassified Caballeronia]MDR5741211.1 LysR substrate-binding domain-containing protein [Caballeronia sp. LZ016]MDR5807109.1 LysR substrate-binding domain-containing protein [Caballeronia sp. LZ019]